MTYFIEQQLVTNFNTIISSLNTDIPAMQGTPPFSGCSVTQPIIGALSDVSSSFLFILYFSPLLG
jgi:hypothetical protein